MYENNFYEEEEETLFTFDDQDFLKCNNNNNNNNNSPLSSRRKTTGSSKYYSIPKENYQYGINSYPCVKRERTGIHARSLPVLIPVDSNSNTSGGGVGSSINKKTTKMRQAVEVETQSNCSSPSWYSQRGVVLTLDNPHHPHLLNHHHNHHNQNNENVLTLEELRNHFNSCFTCGVCWSEEHVSLDCFECGGYSMERPCPLCDGKCNRTWRRDLTMSHAMNKAHWEGECGLASREQEAFYIKNLVDATEDGITEALKDLKASS